MSNKRSGLPLSKGAVASRRSPVPSKALLKFITLVDQTHDYVAFVDPGVDSQILDLELVCQFHIETEPFHTLCLGSGWSYPSSADLSHQLTAGHYCRASSQEASVPVYLFTLDTVLTWSRAAAAFLDGEPLPSPPCSNSYPS